MVGFIECEVFNGNVLIGTLKREAGVKETLFTYDAKYRGPDLAPVLPRGEGPISSHGLHPFFCNLISEGWLKAAQEKLISSGRAPSRLEMLAYFGGDCIGSMRVIPRQPLEALTIKDLEDFSEELAIRSLALIPGVQPKVLAIQDEDGKYYVSERDKPNTKRRITAKDKDENSQFIAKLSPDDVTLTAILETEYITTLITAALLPKDETVKVDLSGVYLRGHANGPTVELTPALVIQRFDREQDGTPIQMYEFNQLLGKASEKKYDGSYKEMADFIRENAVANPNYGIRTNEADIEILFKRILASILVENADTHLKNFALIRRGDEFRLSPNYDLVSCARYKGYESLALGIGGCTKVRMSDIKGKDILQLAKDFRIISDKPTPEEAEKLVCIVGELKQRIEKVREALTGGPRGEFPQLEGLASHSILKRLKVWTGGKMVSHQSIIFDTLEKRWAGTFASLPKLLGLKLSQIETGKRKEAAPLIPAGISQTLFIEARPIA